MRTIVSPPTTHPTPDAMLDHDAQTQCLPATCDQEPLGLR